MLGTYGLPVTVETDPEWQSDRLDLDAYLGRIGFTGPRTPTADTLHRVLRGHMSAIAFENVDIALGRTVSLDLDRIQEKLVRAGRGGYCYENNLLLAAALDRLGFPVTRLLARIRQGETRRRFRTHTVLLVRADDRVWLADAGYGYSGLMEALPLEDGATSSVADWTWRLVAQGPDWVVEIPDGDGGWFGMYSFRQEPQFRIDFEAAHYLSSTRPGSPFVGQLVAQKETEKERRLLRDKSLEIQYADGRVERRELSAAETVCALDELFGVELNDEDERALLRFFAGK
ncbi:arylamine N-acetyltransferase family protein [Streptomyces lateritius]|uniref:arylamine N-acetyltransferase family protein n=1 Tax=Streptomyces lateritius TaxID=67313 RepID=UPI001673F4C7|nr:arylamine N-acetyltransferase [Streptomyces lateritius]GGT92230.1 putative arylamine n-acetyl transferase [Streptomyces lateritius]